LALLQDKYESFGFSVLAFPTNDFRQEYDTNEEIRSFLEDEFPEITFPVLAQSSLADNIVYQQLRKQLPDERDTVQHNFFKYLVDRNGVAVKLFTKKQDPLSLVDDIEALLNIHNKNSDKEEEDPIASASE